MQQINVHEYIKISVKHIVSQHIDLHDDVNNDTHQQN